MSMSLQQNASVAVLSRRHPNIFWADVNHTSDNIIRKLISSDIRLIKVQIALNHTSFILICYIGELIS